MMLGREITLPVDMQGNPESNKDIPNSQYVHDLQECLAFIHNFELNESMCRIVSVNE